MGVLAVIGIIMLVLIILIALLVVYYFWNERKLDVGELIIKKDHLIKLKVGK
ncbi:hypothetical protein KY312_01535 [Candidatus Woesearchaeota archaeon]|nr:hypothetical protein [Candidatus Woesearchaeota archaeon]